MFYLILTACLAGPSGSCGPILLPQGDAATRQECTAQARRISEAWLSGRKGLRSGGTACVATADLPALPLRQIAPGILLFQGDPVQLEDSPDGRIANLAAVVGDASVAVIDSGVSRAQGQQLYAAIRRVTDRPISHLIVTHMHPDHAMGSAVFAEAGAEIVGHRALPRALEARASTYLDNMARLFGPQAMIGTEVLAPDVVVGNRLTIDLGGRVLQLNAAQTAHTDNDLWIRDQATGTLFTGDLVFRDLTPIVDGSVLGWLDWLARPPRPAPPLIVPGHGAISDEWTAAAGPQIRFLKALVDQTRQRIGEGQPMSQAVPQIGKALAPMADGWNSFDMSVARDATAAYKELEWE
ncbi:MAG: quinoprotein relay system zinc metallohydrolase 2 [Paracoccus sp. (in: a-proteobacteria)]|uniref:quinoprotein relay system zinc metallohydrolase 2 n=1 Tax=Paracoccus sp. TaxID=267 RepID=UPI0030020829